MADDQEEGACAFLKNQLHSRGFTYLNVSSRDKHLVVSREKEEHSVLLVRFTLLGENHYNLAITNYRGTWQHTPYIGSLEKLTMLLVDDFDYLLRKN